VASAWPRSLTHPTATGNLSRTNSPAGLNHKLRYGTPVARPAGNHGSWVRLGCVCNFTVDRQLDIL